jgi:SulP family sulfate permease
MVRDSHPLPLLPIITSGLVVGLAEIITTISFAALIFSGALAKYVSSGIGLALFGIAIASIFVALMTSIPGIVAGSQDAPVAIVAVVAATIVGTMPASASLDESFMTVVAFVAMSTFLTGVVLLGLGYFKLGNLVRFLPYPVVGGFLAGTGWLLVMGAMGMLVDTAPSSLQLSALIQPDVLVRWLPGVAIAVALMVLSSRSDHYLIMPAVIIGSILLFYLIALVTGATLAELSEQRWLLGPFPEGSLWEPVMFTKFDLIDWGVVWDSAAAMATIVLVSAVSLLLNSSGLELNSGHDIRLNRELQASGAGNTVAGLVAGVVGFQALGTSTMNLRLGGKSRLVGLIIAMLCGVVLIAGGSFLSYFPNVVLAGLLLYLGLDFLKRWVYEAYFQLPKIDYAIVILILLIAATVGYLEAVAAGILLAVILFVVGYSRVNVVKHQLTGNSYHSRVTRPISQSEVLLQQGERLYLLQLQGFIFFGTADNLLNTVRNRVEDAAPPDAAFPDAALPDAVPPKVSFVVLDFRLVTGLDSTALLRFERMKQLAVANDFLIIIAEHSAEIHRQLQSCGFCENDEVVRMFSNLDLAIEWCENIFLEEAGVDLDQHSPPLLEQLSSILREATNLKDLEVYFQRLEIEPGQYLMRQGDSPDSLYFIEHGQVTAQLEPPGRAPVRLETMGSGRVVGELGFYLDQVRTAAIIADEPSIVYRLNIERLRAMEKSDPEAASTLHQIIIHLLSERVTHLVRTVNALER